MDFNSNKPIFRQIVDIFHSSIINGEWCPGEKVPSVRELAFQLMVNTRTVLAAFDELQRQGIIEPRRGMGYFLAPDAADVVLRQKRKEFFENVVPQVVDSIVSLGIDPSEVCSFIMDRTSVK